MRQGTSLLIACSLLLTSCGAKKEVELVTASSGRSVLHILEQLEQESSKNIRVRPGALLAVYTAEYMTHRVLMDEARGSLTAIDVLQIVTDDTTNVDDPDFQLLQAFADALSVQVADLLNRSDHRDQALDTYSEALTTIAERGNERYRELTSVLVAQKSAASAASKELKAVDKAISTALKNEDYIAAGELQQSLTEKQTAFAEADAAVMKTTNVVSTLQQMLTIYGQKIVVLQKNREALIAGIKVVDIPGVDDLQLIERMRKISTPKGGSFDSLFDGAGLK